MRNWPNKGYHCWVSNLTNHPIKIGDLGISIPPYKTIDLLDWKRSSLTLPAVQMSLEKGALLRKQDEKLIIIRQSKPEKKHLELVPLSKVYIPSRARSFITIEEKKYEELENPFDQAADMEIANELAESELADHAPSIDLNKIQEKQSALDKKV